MSKKQFDHIVEERIKEAAIKNEPPFEGYAWKKMEEKLDAENKRKRYFFIWLVVGVFLILLMCIPKFIYINKPPDYKSIGKNSTTKKDAGKVISKDHFESPSIYLTDNDHRAINKQSITNQKENNLNSKEYKFQKNKLTKKGLLFLKKSIPPFLKNSISGITGLYNQNAADIQLINKDLNKKIIILLPEEKAVIYKIKIFIREDFLSSKNKFGSSIIEKDTAVKKIQQTDNKFSRFYLLASAGADIASVKMFAFKNSTAVIKYGAGFGFKINKNISIQTGFYSSRKKYIAGPLDYKPKKGSYWDMVQLTEVDAACLIYEIPVTVRFNLLQKPSYSLYASTGISSFIMKNEFYYYYYMRYNTAHESAWTYTGNKNLFAVLNFNLGIEKKLSPVFSLLLEPSLSIPLAGVGDGKVKLFSTSFQAGLKYQPLKK